MPLATLEVFTATELDYLIVGGGTAGITLAVRLSEDPNITVGVVEAGGYTAEDPLIDIPGFSGQLLGNAQFDWAFASVPQEYANGKVLPQPRGKGLGGSSVLNFQMINRASAREYDALEHLGNPGWNWKNLLKYMKKSECVTPIGGHVKPEHRALSQLDPDFHGSQGPLKKSLPSYHTDFHQPFYDTVEKLGVPFNSDGETGDNIGAQTWHASVDSATATRSHAANAYFEPHADRPNLLVLVETHVTKIILDRDGDLAKARGAELLKGDAHYTINARMEVIVCAGSFQTPQLLELSGIGDQTRLQANGIQTVVDLPGVGENLQDHVQSFVVYEVDSESNFETLDALRDPDFLTRHQGLYATQQGILSSVLSSVYAYVPATTFTTDTQRASWMKVDGPESAVQQLKRAWLADPHCAQGEIMPMPGCYFDPSLKPTPGSKYLSLIFALTHPLSTGSVHITSDDPRASPAIDPSYYSHHVDRAVMVALSKFVLSICEAEPLKSLVKTRISPSPDFDTLSDSALMQYLKDTIGCVYHPVGTCSMLPRTEGGVVDSSLKVYGTTNLRVVDASIVPVALACHSQSLVYAIAEKAADMIKDQACV